MKVLVLDTGPLIEYLVARFGSQRALDRIAGHIRNKDDPTFFERFLRGWPCRMTVSGVLAEVHRHLCNLERLLGNGGWGDVWRRVHGDWSSLGITEELVCLMDLKVDFLQSDGPVDAALAKLAERHRRRYAEVRLLSSEQRSHGRWLHQNIPVLWPGDAMDGMRSERA